MALTRPWFQGVAVGVATIAAVRSYTQWQARDELELLRRRVREQGYGVQAPSATEPAARPLVLQEPLDWGVEARVAAIRSWNNSVRTLHHTIQHFDLQRTIEEWKMWLQQQTRK